MDASQALRGPVASCHRMPRLRAPAARSSRCRCVGVKALMQRDVSPSNKARSPPSVAGGRNTQDHKSQRSQVAQQLNSLWLKEALVQDDAPARPNTHGVSNSSRGGATAAPPSRPPSTPPPVAQQQRPANSAVGSNGSSSSPQPSVASDTILYFAYGANLAFETLSRRGVKIASRDAAVIRDPSVRMRFKHRGGYATLERVLDRSVCKYTPYTNQHVHGVLYKLGLAEFKKLQQFEGGYEVAEFEVETYDGHVTVAKAFVSGPMSLLPQEVTPTEKYMRLLRDGAADNYLHPLYQAWLSSIETVTSTGLGPEYFNTPSKAVAFSFLFVSALTAAAFYFQ